MLTLIFHGTPQSSDMRVDTTKVTHRMLAAALAEDVRPGKGDMTEIFQSGPIPRNGKDRAAHSRHWGFEADFTSVVSLP